MATYSVIWRDNGDHYMVTTVELDDVIDANQLSTNEWADLAWAAECEANGCTEEEAAVFVAEEDGYDLITVLVGTPKFQIKF